MVTVDETTTVQCVAFAAAPEFIDMTGTITGTIGDTYNPTFVGERGFMAFGDAEPLDFDTPTTGGALAVCFLHTPQEIDAEMRTSIPIEAPE